jgi:hypothetical protein
MAQKLSLRYFEDVLHEYLPILQESDIHGNTCVHFAAGSGASLAQLEALARAGAPMERTNNARQTFLHVLNVKLYNRDTLLPIIEWALRTKGAMAERDSRNRTVWHTIFQRGVSLEIFHSILPYLLPRKDDMMELDEDDHTPLDCLRSYWTSTKDGAAIDRFKYLQDCGILPLYFAINQTAPLDNTVYAGTSARLPKSPALPANISRLTIGASTRRYDSNEPTKHDVGDLISTFVNGGVLDCTNIMLPNPTPSLSSGPAIPSPLPKRVPEKARRSPWNLIQSYIK